MVQVNHGFGVRNNNKMVMRMPARLRSYVVSAPYKHKAYQEVLQNYKSDTGEADDTDTVHYMYTYGFLSHDFREVAQDYITIEFGKGVFPLYHNGRFSKGLLSAIAASGGDALDMLEAALRTEQARFSTTYEVDVKEFRAKHAAWKDVALVLRLRFKRLIAAVLKSFSAQRKAVREGGALLQLESLDEDDVDPAYSLYRVILDADVDTDQVLGNEGMPADTAATASGTPQRTGDQTSKDSQHSDEL